MATDKSGTRRGRRRGGQELPDEVSAVSLLKAEVLSTEATQLAEQGLDLQTQEKSELATKELNEALEKTPKNPELWAARGLLELKLPWPKARAREATPRPMPELAPVTQATPSPGAARYPDAMAGSC